MKKIKSQRNNTYLSLLFLVGSFFFLIIIVIYIFNLDKDITKKVIKSNLEIQIPMIEKEKEKKENIENTNIKKEINNNHIAILEIEKINLKQYLYDINSQKNDVNKNVEIIKGSNLPDILYGNLILAGHSGSGKVAFFNRLNELEVNDIVNVYYKNIKYQYQIYNIYEIEKTGKAEIKRYKDENTLTLITCKVNTNKQIIIVSTLINKEE